MDIKNIKTKYLDQYLSQGVSNLDSLVGMKNLPDSCIDLVLTDPPYGIASKGKLTKSGGKIVSTSQAWGNDFQDAWEDMNAYWDWFKPYVGQFHRVMKDGASCIVFLDRKYTGLFTYLIEQEFDLHFKNKVYFKKVNPVPGITKLNYRSSIEEAIWFTKGKGYTFNFGSQKEMTQCYEGPIGKKATGHPTEKYGWMMNPLVKNHTNPGDLILDAFAGSGSTIVSAWKQGRKAIGFEKNPEFFKMAHARCNQVQQELNETHTANQLMAEEELQAQALLLEAA
ncbi:MULTISPECIES: DNA-methyltransferase [Burkholderia]|uniref:DNA-methyltransferase n=1 Tax=Burkholderia TaxID=32008 RepID=UPI0015E282EA|nr:MULTISPECIES: site-specific DNA-methyltransferase [Burkholderia cepacia complex]MBR8001848.1 site-specific DNA-methyltransferase [Burkholderia vietnamiensis]